MKFFVAIYTNECKAYCDKEFFSRIVRLSHSDHEVHVVDNSLDIEYFEKLITMLPGSVTLYHVTVDREDRSTLFHRNVSESLEILREQFLATDCEKFVTIESDVIVPLDVLQLFEEVANSADIIGGIYHAEHHSWQDFQEGNISLVEDRRGHILSGCTMYDRKVVETIPFRWSRQDMKAYPDAWICYDAVRNGNGFVLRNYQKIKCGHLECDDGARGRTLLR